MNFTLNPITQLTQLTSQHNQPINQSTSHYLKNDLMTLSVDFSNLFNEPFSYTSPS